MNTVTITLRNKGLTPIDASVVETSDPARFTTGTAPGIIPPKGTATLDVNYLAAAEGGAHRGFLIIRAGNLVIPLFGGTLEYEIDGGLGGGQLEYRMVSDDAGEWFEVGFLSPSNDLLGNAADGWTDAGGNLLFRFHRSEDLVNWDHQWSDAPGSPEGPDGEGDYKYWARSEVPKVWKFVTIDLTATSARYGKSITAIHLFGDLISLPNYPYAMPADAATLETDLLAAGYTDAEVTTVPGPFAVEVRKWTPLAFGYDIAVYQTTLSGMDVTQVRTPTGTPISLPSYPYTMPGDKADLQADLIAAGHSGTVVRLFDDEWTVFIPDRETILSDRDFVLTITPDDPNSAGPDNKVIGSFSNVRATTGLTALDEAPKQFARLGVSRGPNYQFDP